MIKYLYPLFFLSSIWNVTAQDKIEFITLKVKKPLQMMDFHCDEVIDLRNDKKSIGFIRKGLSKKKRIADFPDDFENYLKKSIDILLPKKENSIGIILGIRGIDISEYEGHREEIGKCRMQIEICKKEGDIIYSIGYEDIVIKGKGIDVTKGHSKRILKTIEKALTRFRVRDNIYRKGILLDEALAIPKWDLNQVPKKGLYSSLGQLLQQRPFLENGFDVQVILKETHFPQYTLHKEIGNIETPFISDGEDLFIKAELYGGKGYYRKAKYLGKYIYVEDYIPIHQTSTGSMMGSIVGPVGSAIGYALDYNIRSLGYILNTDTGNCYFLDRLNLSALLKEHPDLIEEFEKSNKEPEDVANIIRKLNEKSK